MLWLLKINNNNELNMQKKKNNICSGLVISSSKSRENKQHIVDYLTEQHMYQIFEISIFAYLKSVF